MADSTARGYLLEDFQPLWQQYLGARNPSTDTPDSEALESEIVNHDAGCNTSSQAQREAEAEAEWDQWPPFSLPRPATRVNPVEDPRDEEQRKREYFAAVATDPRYAWMKTATTEALRRHREELERALGLSPA